MPARIFLLRVAFLAGVVLALSQGFPAAAEAADVKIDPAKVEQLKRVEPLTAEKLGIFVQAGALSASQAKLLQRFIDKQGRLKVPLRYQGAEPARPARPARTAAPAAASGKAPRRADGSLDVLAWIRADDRRPMGNLTPAQRAHLEARVKAYRQAGLGEREAIRRDLRAAGPGANRMIAAHYNDPVDLDLKRSLWKAVAGPRNPRAAGYISYTHQKAVETAAPVLVSYDKDIGGLILRREKGRQEPRRLYYSSRTLRGIVLDLEKAVSNCSGVRAASYLMDVYAARYGPDEAPMRDKDRDRHRMVAACGGDKRRFDQDEPDKWKSRLGPLERALIAERLVPHLRAHEKHLRQIAANGLMVVLGVREKNMKKRLIDRAYKDWPAFRRWYKKQRERMLAGR